MQKRYFGGESAYKEHEYNGCDQGSYQCSQHVAKEYYPESLCA